MKTGRFWVLGVALSLCAGAALAQGFGGRGFGGPGGGTLGLLMIPEVRKELKLDEAQTDLLEALGQEMRGRMRELFQGGGGGQGGNREEFQRRMEAMNAEQTKKVGEILDAKQMARLRQLLWQQSGSRALGDREVQTQLKLTPDQVQKVQAALQAERDAMRSTFESLRGGGGGDFSAIREKMTALRSATDTKLNGILTEPQKKQWQGMLGAPFKFPERRFGPGGRPGTPRQSAG